MRLSFVKLKNRIRGISLKSTYKSVTKPMRIFGWITIASLCLAITFAILYNGAANAIESQHISERWSGDSKVGYAQVSLFLPEDGNLTLNSIRDFEQKVKLAVADTLPENVVNPFADCYSSTGDMKITGEHGSADVEITAVAGDYFILHPLKLVSGNYISDDDVMHDRLVITKDLAWILFGSIDVAGMEVTINYQPFKIAGVVEVESDKFSEKTIQNMNVAYMSYDTFSFMTVSESGDDNTNAKEAHISSYEIVMPNPVKGFAKSLVSAELNSNSSGIVVENSSRYEKEVIFETLKSFGERTLHSDTVEFPYYENAARLSENMCALYLLLNIIFSICPIVFALIMIIKAYKVLKKLTNDKITDIKDRYEERTLFKRQRGRHLDG